MQVGRLAIAVCMLLSEAAAGAENLSSHSVSARLIYERGFGAASCPDEEELRAAVAKRVGFDAFDEAAERLLSCRVERVGRVLRARIDVGFGSNQQPAARELVSAQADCRELAEAVQLAFSIAINPLVVAAQAESAPSSEPPPVENRPNPALSSKLAESAHFAAAKPPPTIAAPRSAAQTPGLRLRLGADAAIPAGLDPGLAYAASLHTGLRRNRLSVSLEFRALAPSSFAVGRGSLHVWQWAALLAPCTHWGAFAACLVGSAGRIHGRGEGFVINEQSSSLSASAGARAAWEYPQHGQKLRLRLSLDLMVALTQPHFALGGVDAWAPPPVAAVLGVGMLGDFFQ